MDYATQAVIAQMSAFQTLVKQAVIKKALSILAAGGSTEREQNFSMWVIRESGSATARLSPVLATQLIEGVAFTYTPASEGVEESIQVDDATMNTLVNQVWSTIAFL